MGILKFPFPNPEDIYLHDTPDHAKFNLANRNLSNGCVRVEDARRLGTWLLGRRPVSPGDTPEIRVQLPRADADLPDLHYGAGAATASSAICPIFMAGISQPPQFASNYCKPTSSAAVWLSRGERLGARTSAA